MADISKIVIPDSVRLAQYDAKSSIDDVAQNLSSKYKQFADEIKKVIETILKQNIENENQISFRLANKILEDERETLQKFLNDETFSPDIDGLVTEACEKASTEIYINTHLTKFDIEDLKTFLLSELKKVSEKTSKARESIIDEIKGKIAESQPHEDRNEKTVNDALSFETFDGIRYFTGWLTASFIKKFETSQIAAFNSIGQSISSIESVFKNMSSAIAARVKTAGGDERVRQTIKDVEEHRVSTIDLGNSFGANTVNMIMRLRSRQAMQNKAKQAAFSGLSGIAHGLFNAVESIGKEISKISMNVIKKTVDMSTKLLKNIVKMTVWTTEKVLGSVVTWAMAAALIWKFWLSDNFKASVTDWIMEWAKKIGEMLKIDKIIEIVKEYYINKIKARIKRHTDKFKNYYDEEWAKPIANLKKYLTDSVKPMIEWVNNVKKSLTDSETYKKFEQAVNTIQDTWTFLSEKVLAKPFAAVFEMGHDIFESMRDAGDWLWGVMTGKISWREAGEQFSKNIWHPVVNSMHDIMHEMTNFISINGNWLLDFFGVTEFRFDVPTNKNGNVLTGDETKSIFEKAGEAIMGFGSKHKEIVLDKDTNTTIIIDPMKIGKGALEGGVILTWQRDDVKKALKLPGVDDTINKLERLANDITGALNAIAGGAMIFAGGLVGAWVGRLVGIIATVIGAAFTGGSVLAGLGAAMNIGESVGNIIGSLIGYFFFDSMTSAKEYFSSGKNENLAEKMGVSKEAASTLDSAWEMPDFSRMAGRLTGDEADSISAGMPFRQTLKPIDVKRMDEEDQAAFSQMGFNKDVYDKFNKMFSLASADPDKMPKEALATRRMLKNAMTPKGEEYFEHFDRNLESLMGMDVNGEDLVDILGRKAAGQKNLSDLAYAMNPWQGKADILYAKLTKTGNDWVDMMLQHIIEQNKHLSLDELTLAIDGKHSVGDNVSGTYSIMGENGNEVHWAFVPIVSSLMSIRMALAMFQTKIQKEIERSILLFSGENILDGEKHVLRNIQRMLLGSVYDRPDEENKKFARAFWKRLFGNLWHEERSGKNLLESTRILFNNLRDKQRMFTGIGLSDDERRAIAIYESVQSKDDLSKEKMSLFDFISAISGGEDIRIRNILSTIAPYTALIQDNDKLKAGGLEMTRDEISNMLLHYPDAIGIFLGSGEIAEAFSSETGEAVRKLSSDNERVKYLKSVFSKIDNSLITAMNDRMAKILDDFDDLYENDNAALMDQLSKLLAEVNNSDWENKILGRINSGLAYKEDYEALNRKIVDLRALLAKRGINYTVNDEGKYIIILPKQQTLGESMSQDTQMGFGHTWIMQSATPN